MIAQTVIEIEDKRGKAIFGAKTIILSENGDVLYRGLSDIKGVLKIEKHTIPHNRIAIRINVFGFAPLDTNILVQPKVNVVLEEIILNKEEVVVTAQYSNNSVENSVHRIKVKKKKKIDAMGAVNLRDVLTNEVGVRISQDNVLGSSMTLQGISGENVKILIDGVPVVGRLGGDIDVSQINLQEIDHIEIVEGPLSVSYGTNALAGVVNLISKKPVFRNLKLTSSSYYESSGHFNFSGELAYGMRQQSIGISVGRNFFDGWNDNQKGWLFRYKLNIFNELVINKGYPRVPYLETAFDDEYNTRRVDQSIKIKKRISQKGIFNSIFSYNRYDRTKNTYFVDLTSLNRQLTNNVSDQDTSVFDQWLLRGNYTSLKDSAKLSFQLGYDILIESAEGRRILDKRQTQADYALFATVEYQPIKALIIRPGIRYSYNTTYEPPVLPSLNLKWKFGRNSNFRCSYARGFRAPGIKELYFEFIDINHNIIGNENLIAESSHNISSSISYNQKKKKGNIEYQLNGFYNTIKNRISLATIEGTKYSYTNIGQFKTTGTRFSLSLKYNQITAKSALGLTGRASNAFSESLNSHYLFYPEVQTYIIYTFRNIKTNLAIFYKYQGELPNFRIDEGENISEDITDDYHLLDCTITKKFWNQNMVLTIGAKNILNITQVFSNSNNDIHSSSSNSVSVGTGRTYFIRLQLNLSKRLKDK